MRPGSPREQGEGRREPHEAPSPLVHVPFLHGMLLLSGERPASTGWPETRHSTHEKSNFRPCGAWRQGYTYHPHTQRLLHLPQQFSFWRTKCLRLPIDIAMVKVTIST